MHMLITTSIIYLFLLKFNESATTYMGGIPVPGRTVPILRLLENYAYSCTPSNKRNFGMDQLSEIMQSLNAEEVAQKVYNALFFAMADVDINNLMGKWYTVVDSKSVHPADCTITNFQLIMTTEYTATFSVMQHTLTQGASASSEGFGRMMGPDPGELFISTGNSNDNCPYVPVKMGGITPSGDYDYMILSQPLKFPTMVLTRDPRKFERKHKTEVYKFLEKYGFLSPMAALNTRLHFTNATQCNWDLID